MKIQKTNRSVESKDTTAEENFCRQIENAATNSKSSTSNLRVTIVIVVLLLMCSVGTASAFDGNYTVYGYEINWETIAIGYAWSLVCALITLVGLKLSAAMVNDIKSLRN